MIVKLAKRVLFHPWVVVPALFVTCGSIVYWSYSNKLRNPLPEIEKTNHIRVKDSGTTVEVIVLDDVEYVVVHGGRGVGVCKK